MLADNSWKTKGKVSPLTKTNAGASGDGKDQGSGNKPTSTTISLSSAREAQRMVLDGAKYPGGARDNPGSAVYVGTQPTEEPHDLPVAGYKLGGVRKPGVDGGVNTGNTGTGRGANSNSTTSDSKGTGFGSNKNTVLANSSKNKFASNAGPKDVNDVVASPPNDGNVTSETNQGESEDVGGNPLSPGRTKGLAGFWSNQNDQVKGVKKKRFVADSSFEGADPTLPCTLIVENTPLRPADGIIRAEDPGEWQKPIEVEGGRAKNLANSFQMRQTKPNEPPVPQPRKQILLNTTAPGGGDETTCNEGDYNQQQVKVRDISDKMGRQTKQDPPKAGPRGDRASFGGNSGAAGDRASFGGTPTDKASFGGTAGDRASYGGNVSDRLSSGGNVSDRISFGGTTAIVLAENVPEELDADVVKSEVQAKDEPVFEAGRTKNLMQLWKNTEAEYNAPKTSTSRLVVGAKPTWIAEIEEAKGITVDIVATGQPPETNWEEDNKSGASATGDAYSHNNPATFKDNKYNPPTYHEPSRVDTFTTEAAPNSRRFEKSSAVFEGGVKSERGVGGGGAKSAAFNCDEYRIAAEFSDLKLTGPGGKTSEERRFEDEWNSQTTTIVPVKTGLQSNSTRYERKDLLSTSSYTTAPAVTSSHTNTSHYATPSTSTDLPSASAVTSSNYTSPSVTSAYDTKSDVTVETARQELDTAQDMLMDILNELQSAGQSNTGNVTGGDQWSVGQSNTGQVAGGDQWYDSVTAASDTSRVLPHNTDVHYQEPSQTYPTHLDQVPSSSLDSSYAPSANQWSTTPSASDPPTTTNDESSTRVFDTLSPPPPYTYPGSDNTQRDSMISASSSPPSSRPQSHFEDAQEMPTSSSGYPGESMAGRDRSPARTPAKPAKKSGKPEEKSGCNMM